MLKEGCGLRGIARLLKISVSTVLRRILLIARKLKKPLAAPGQTYELDELCTYTQQKTNQCWVVYALSRETNEVVDFAVGNRSNAVLKQVTSTLLLSDAKKIYTDKLKQYTTLLPRSLHRTTLHGDEPYRAYEPYAAHAFEKTKQTNDLF
jgi:transposase-like protein